MTEILPAGRDLDTLVAERVFGSVTAHSPCGDGLTRTNPYFGATLVECDVAIRIAYAEQVAKGMKLWPAQYIGPEYSTDIAAAWLVAENLGARWLYLRLEHVLGQRFWAHFTRTPSQAEGWGVGAEEDGAPLAICRAALKAVSQLSERRDSSTSAVPETPRREGRE